MVVPVLSMSASHASFEAELQGSILQQTASVDYYLQTAAPKWSANCSHNHATPQALRSMYMEDLSSTFWQTFVLDQGEITPYEDLDHGASSSRSLPAARNAAQLAPSIPQLHKCSRKRRQRTQPLQHASNDVQLQQFLKDDMELYMQLREQLESQASESAAAVLSRQPDEQQHRTSSCCSSRSNSSISFVRLPEIDSHLAADDSAVEEHSAVAAAAAAAAAMAAVDRMLSSPKSAAAELRCSSEKAAARTSSMSAGVHGHQFPDITHVQAAAVTPQGPWKQQKPANSCPGMPTAMAEVQPTAAAAASPEPMLASAASHAMEADEDIAAQKEAARARLAELEGQALEVETERCEVPLTASSKGAATPSKATADWPDYGMRLAPGSMHSTAVPERPRALHARAAMVYSPMHGQDLVSSFSRLVERLFSVESFGSSSGAMLQQSHFLHSMLVGLLLCTVLLPVLLLVQAGSTQASSMGFSLIPAWVSTQVQQLWNVLYLPCAAGVLLYCFARSVTLQPPLLQFSRPELEQQYLLWSNSGKLLMDCLFQLMFLAISSCLWVRLQQDGRDEDESLLTGPISTRSLLSMAAFVGFSLPIVALVALRSRRYVEWREPLLVGSRLWAVVALAAMQLLSPGDGGTGSVLSQLQLSMPCVALAQVMGIACMQVRLATFVPFQILHLLVLLLKTQAPNQLLLFTQLFGGGLCLPILLLHSMEVHSRKAFLATLASCHQPGGKAV